MLQEGGLTLYWQSGLESGMLEKEGKKAFFKAESHAILMDGRLGLGAIELRNDGLYIDETGFNELLNYFTGRPIPQSAGKHRISVILIDAGHGGRDPGSIGRHGSLSVYEKDVTLFVAKSLERLLKQKYPDKKILMTRDGDSYPTLEERVALANGQKMAENEAEIYISIHANASLNKKAKGFEVWRLPDKYDRTVYESNEYSSNAQSALNAVLSEEYLAEGAKLADFILDAMHSRLQGKTENRGVREQSWFVVRNARMAAVLIELGFVTNAEEAKNLADPAYLQILSQSLYNGLINFIRYFEE